VRSENLLLTCHCKECGDFIIYNTVEFSLRAVDAAYSRRERRESTSLLMNSSEAVQRCISEHGVALTYVRVPLKPNKYAQKYLLGKAF